jgi:3-oxoacyl-[acyl-carrier protein] reductase
VIDLTGRVALVTGGSRGIGAATAITLATAGADVAVHWSAAEAGAEKVASAVRHAGRKAWPLRADLGHPEGAHALAAALQEVTDRLDILVHNAGIWTHGPIETMALETWRATMQLNLDAAFVLTQDLLPLLRRSSSAAIVFVTSTAAQRGEAQHSHYAASKAALQGFTKSLAVELAPQVRVNAVAPGWVDTDAVRRVLDDPRQRREIEAAIPRQRVASPEEIAGPIVFLASDLARHVTGEILNVNGGAVLCG